MYYIKNLKLIHNITLFGNYCKFSQNNSNIEYCINYVKKLDYESYLCILLLPKLTRTPSIILRSFMIELSQIQDNVSNPQIGMIKFRYWKDAIDQIYLTKTSPVSPICQELNKIVIKYGITKNWLSRMIESREDEMISDSAFMDIVSAEEFYMKSIAPFYLLLLQIGGFKSLEIDHVIGHISKGQGLVTLLRSVSFHAKRRKVYLPHSLMIKHSVTQQDIVNQISNKNTEEIFFDIAATANSHFEKASNLLLKMPKLINNHFLFATPSKLFLRTILKKDFNIFDQKLSKRNSYLPLLLIYNKYRSII